MTKRRRKEGFAAALDLNLRRRSRADTHGPLNVFGLLLGAHVAGRQHVELVFLCIELPVLEPEDDTGDGANNSHAAVVPDEQGVGAQREEGLANGSGQGGHEEGKGGNKRPHVLRSLGETVLERGDGSHDLGEGDEHVGTGLGPDVDGDILAVGAGRVVTALGVLVDVGLHDAGPDHGSAAEPETGCDLLDGGEADASLAKGRVEEKIADGDEDDQGKGIEIGQHIVGDAMEGHDGGLRGEVVVDLVVSDPVERVPEEDAAGGPATTDLVNPGVVKVHPSRTGFVREGGGLDGVPEGAVVHVPVGLDWIDGPAALGTEHEELDSGTEDASLGGAPLVHVAAEVEDGERADEENGGDQEGEVETNVALGVGHAELAGKGTDVDEEVEPVVDSGGGDGRVDNDALSGLEGPDVHVLVGDLLGDERRDVGLETTGADTHDDQTDDEAAQRRVSVGHDGWNGRDGQDDVANDGDADGHPDSTETTEVSIGDVGTKERDQINPELVEGG